MAVRNAPPRASSMMESLRGLGYSTSTALADIIDNSVSANSKNISITLHWADEESWIRIIDDGRGMDDLSLENAMRLSVSDPRKERNVEDLGRFGLGLKTASFSQARRLTVASKCNGGEIVCLRWDLDQLGQEHGVEWPLFEGAAKGSENLFDPLFGMSSGTIVLWEKLDRIVTEGFSYQDMLELADRIEAQLSMTFHRLIGDRDAKLRIHLNEKVIKAWDPFLIGNPSKALESPEYRILHTSGVTVQCHVLPHRDMLSNEEYDSAAGPFGWILQQGFYVYRNRRLLLSGGWLGIGDGNKAWTRDEAHRLARIRVDIPNTVDDEWKINVMKSSASPPVRLRRQLYKIATDTRLKARNVFAHRGHLMPISGIKTNRLTDLWQIKRSSKGTSYKIARDHDLVASIINQSGPLKSDINILFRLIEETIPVQRIWLDTAEDKEVPRNGFSDSDQEEIFETLSAIYESLVKFRGLSSKEAINRISRSPPFDMYPDLVAKLKLKDDL